MSYDAMDDSEMDFEYQHPRYQKPSLFQPFSPASSRLDSSFFAKASTSRDCPSQGPSLFKQQPSTKPAMATDLGPSPSDDQPSNASPIPNDTTMAMVLYDEPASQPPPSSDSRRPHRLDPQPTPPPPPDNKSTFGFPSFRRRFAPKEPKKPPTTPPTPYPQTMADPDQMEIDHDDPSIPTPYPYPSMATPSYSYPMEASFYRHDPEADKRSVILFYSGLLRIGCEIAFYCMLFYLAIQFLITLKHDMSTKMAVYESNHLEKQLKCSQDYHINQCESHPRPAMEEACRQWQMCFFEPAWIGKSKVIAETFADIVNGFVDTISYKSMVFGSVLVLLWLLSRRTRGAT
ncbi:hypothetical protein DM01DRAFT_1410469 [Hesseltinella vesiculosa]|uniref:Brl1/Brr6 domain-containing protein n=1 Tax=Hesseltinella vesiculosa TaxID=101127 RepID=A0A1X2G854_9FUNG|nr:hypothetical protein DM01DRAFT_1410469 [Hesseltinella vesiculosa]